MNNLPDEPTVSLRDYIDIRFDALDKAVTKADAASEKRFESTNEWRATMNDKDRLVMPRTEAENLIRGLSDKIEALTLRLNAKDDQNRGQSSVWAYLIAGVGLLSALVSMGFLIARR